MNKLFVQFINKGPLCRVKNEPFYVFQNGLSSAWDRCKNKGKMIWVEAGEHIPDFDGIVYVSGWFYQDMIETYRFAKRNPNSSIILGGPIINQACRNTTYKLSNITLSKGDAEQEIFGNTLLGNNWNLEIPQKYNDAHVSWTYSIDRDTSCYWGKCTFCRAASKKEKLINHTRTTIPIIEVGKTKSIWFGSVCLSPIELFKTYSILPKRDDVFYFSYIRATEDSANSIETALKMSKSGKQCSFVCGIEFPGNRMLKWMKKGMTKEEQLYTIKTLTNLGCEVNLNFIVDWVGLIDEDIKEATDFFNQLKSIQKNNLSAKIYQFHIKDQSPMMNIYKGEKELAKNSLGDYEHYLPILSEKDLKLNTKLRNLYMNFPWLSLDIHQTWREHA